MRKVFILLLFLNSLILQIVSQHIPQHLHKALKHARTFKELADSLHIDYHPPVAAHKTHHRTHSARPKMRIQGASITGSLKAGKMEAIQADGSPGFVEHDVDEETRRDLQLFDSIRQGNDTCQLQSVCVPVNITVDDPRIIVYPKCFEVMRCVGSCCDASESCHPHRIEARQFTVIELEYQGNERFNIKGKRNITMEEHTSCSCYDCGTMEGKCPPGLVVSARCECECANRDEERQCRGYWNTDNCSCDCIPQACPASQDFNVKTCSCELLHDQSVPHRLPVDFDEGELIDVSQLPSLEPKWSKSRNG